MTENIHPDLANEYSHLSKIPVVVLLAPLLFAAAFSTAGLVFGQRGDSDHARLLFLIAGTCVTVTALGLLLRHQLSRFFSNDLDAIRTASRLMLGSDPKKMTMRDGVAMPDIALAKTSLIHLEDSLPATFPAAFPAAVTFPRYKRPTKGEHQVEVYFDPSISGNTLVLRYDGAVARGKYLTYADIMANLPTLRLLFVPLVLISALLLITTDRKYRQAEKLAVLAAESRSWPQTEATIISSTVQKTVTGSGRSRIEASRAQIEYTYNVAEKPYRGDMPWVSYAPSSRSKPAEEIVARYPSASQIRISYNPADPSFSVLEAGHEHDANAELDNIKEQEMVILAICLFFLTLLGGIRFFLRRRVLQFAEVYRQ